MRSAGTLLGSLAAHEAPKLTRSSLTGQVLDILRERVLDGKLAPGMPLSERDIAQQLGVSRFPVRDALIRLEDEGLVVGGANCRYVIQLTERDVRELYQVRLALEKLAVRLAVQNLCDEKCVALRQCYAAMAAAVACGDGAAYRRSDIELHRAIWLQAGNVHLVKALNSFVGPIFMLVARHSAYYDWTETLHLHEYLVSHIYAGDAAAAEVSMERHTENARQRSLLLFARGLL